jgi:hypothetical protein
VIDETDLKGCYNSKTINFYANIFGFLISLSSQEFSVRKIGSRRNKIK